MTQFSISGERAGKHVTITWTDGVLSGDPDTVAWIEQLAEMQEGHTVRMLVGPATTHDHLASPWSACSLMRSVFLDPRKTTMRGELPAIDAPDGAIL